MQQQWLHKFIQVKEAAGIDISILPDNSYLMNVVIVRRDKQSLVKTEEYFHITGIEKIKEKVPLKIPVGISLSGKGILHKPVPAHIKEHIITAIIPGAHPKDYYYQQFSVGEGEEVAITRKEQLDQVAALFISAGYTVLDAGLSLGSIDNIIHLVKADQGRTAETTLFNIQLLKNGGMASYEVVVPQTGPMRLKPECSIGAQTLRSNLLPAFGVAAQVLTNAYKQAAIEQPDILQQREQYRYRRLFQTAGWSLLSFLLLVLLINFFIYQHYYSLNQVASVNRTLHTARLNSLDTLERKVTEKTKFLHAIGWVKHTTISEISDKIAATVPTDVTLTDMIIFPVKMDDRIGGRFTIKQDTVQLQGYCDTPAVLNRWISDLSGVDIIQSARLLNYWYKKEDDSGNFLIELVLKP